MGFRFGVPRPAAQSDWKTDRQPAGSSAGLRVKVRAPSARETLQCNCRAGSARRYTWDQSLPADRYLWLLRVIRRMRCREVGTEYWRSILAVPFLALGKVNFEAVEAGEVPCGAGERHPHFLVNTPNIAVHP